MFRYFVSKNIDIEGVQLLVSNHRVAVSITPIGAKTLAAVSCERNIIKLRVTLIESKNEYCRDDFAHIFELLGEVKYKLKIERQILFFDCPFEDSMEIKKVFSLTEKILKHILRQHNIEQFIIGEHYL